MEYLNIEFKNHTGATAPRIYDDFIKDNEQPLQKTIWQVVDGVVKIINKSINEETYILPRWSPN
jgi:hypothetical protein